MQDLPPALAEYIQVINRLFKNIETLIGQFEQSCERLDLELAMSLASRLSETWVELAPPMLVYVRSYPEWEAGAPCGEIILEQATYWTDCTRKVLKVLAEGRTHTDGADNDFVLNHTRRGLNRLRALEFAF